MRTKQQQEQARYNGWHRELVKLIEFYMSGLITFDEFGEKVSVMHGAVLQGRLKRAGVIDPATGLKY